MAIVLVNSDVITNLVASPPVQNPAYVDGGRVRVQDATVEVTNGNDIASIFRLFRVRSNWKIIDIRVYCDAITSAAADVGLYRTTADGAAVVDVDAYASAFSIATAITQGTSIRFESAASGGDVANINKRVWENAGATVDSNLEYDIAATLTAAAAASGTLSVRLFYTDGS